MTNTRLSHAYLIIGSEGDNRDKAAKHLAAALLCTEGNPPCGQCRNCKKVFAGIHPDVIFLRRTMGDNGQLHREILVEQIRNATADAAVAPNEADRKVYIIPEADRLNLQSQNALLKSLEDPPGHAAFILCAAASDALLPTVRSRCVRIDDYQRSLETPPLTDFAREYLNAAASGQVADVVSFCMLRTKLTREDTEDFLEQVLSALDDILCGRRENPGLTQQYILKLTALFEEARVFLLRYISPKQIFGLLAAETLR